MILLQNISYSFYHVMSVKFHFNIPFYLVFMRFLVILILGLYLAGEQCQGQTQRGRRGRQSMNVGRESSSFKCTECRENTMYEAYVCQSCIKGSEGDEPFTCSDCKFGQSRSMPFVCDRCKGETAKPTTKATTTEASRSTFSGFHT